MSSLVWAGVRSVAGKITRSALETRTSRPPASTKTSPERAIAGEDAMTRRAAALQVQPAPARRARRGLAVAIGLGHVHGLGRARLRLAEGEVQQRPEDRHDEDQHEDRRDPQAGPALADHADD